MPNAFYIQQLTTLKTAIAEGVSVAEAAANVQTKFRHRERNIPRKCKGSTLLPSDIGRKE